MKAQFLSAPLYVAGALPALVRGKLSDRFNLGAPFAAIPGAFNLARYSIMPFLILAPLSRRQLVSAH